MAISLDSIKKTKHSSPPRIVIHGAEKVGKSTFMAGIPNSIFIQTEDGLTGVDAQAFPLSKSYEEVIEALNILINQEHDYKAVVIDSADWLERLIWDRVCSDYNVKSIETAAGGYGKGYSVALNYWRELLALLDTLNKEKMMVIGLICHSRIVTFNDPETEPYDLYKMKLHDPKSGNGAMALLNEWADVIGFANKAKFTTEKKGSEKTFKGTTTHERKLFLEGTPAYIAGNRYGLPAEMPLSWQSFQQSFKKPANINEEAKNA